MSEIRATTISDETGNGPIALTKQSAAKVWIHIGSGGSSIGDSVNVASLVDAGTGDYTINFTNNMASSNFSESCTITFDHTSGSNNLRNLVGEGKASSNFEVNSCYVNSSGSFISYDIETSAGTTIHGDLA